MLQNLKGIIQFDISKLAREYEIFYDLNQLYIRANIHKIFIKNNLLFIKYSRCTISDFFFSFQFQYYTAMFKFHYLLYIM
jgi:hypothetical protein